MNPRRPTYLRHVACASAFGLTALPAHAAQGATALPQRHLPPVFSLRQNLAGHFLFRRDGVLGTSLELIVRSTHMDNARECERQVLGEIARLRNILSTYDPASEISRHLARDTVALSPELEEVLVAYHYWSELTDGALSLNLAQVIQLWKNAALTGQLPNRAALHTASQSPKAFNVDALGKGYIIDHAVQIARQLAPEGLLNIGGDIRAWGDRSWLIGVADPRQPADNAPLLAQFALRNAAVATSGGYLRFYEIAGERFSHVIDPRTQWPTAHRVSATITAPDSLSANALSTAACVLGLEQGVELALRHSSEYILIDAAGHVRRSAAFFVVAATGDSNAPSTSSPASTTPTPSPTPAKSSPPSSSTNNSSNDKSPTLAQSTPTNPWPADFQVYFYLTLRDTSGGGSKHPYIAVWIEDTKHHVIRNLSIWGTDLKYLPQLTNWWTEFGQSAEITDARYVQSITRATRADGQYAIIWDGRDDKGAPVSQGDYNVVVEINRENGNHIKQVTAIRCGDQPLSLPMHPTAESLPATLHYVNKLPPGIETK